MKFFPAAVAVFLLAGGAARAQDEISLPEWQDGGRKAAEETGWVAGADLLAGDAAEPLDLPPPRPEEIADDAKPVPLVPEEFLAAYFAARPASFLVDPQHLLDPAQFRDRLDFLENHAAESSIDLFVYLMDGGQEIPGEVRSEETIERFFTTGRPAMLVFYYLGAPQRAAVYLSPSLTDAVPASEQHRALESSVLQALERTEGPEQLEKFLIQMSIRIYWMERLVAGEPAAAAEIPQARPAAGGEAVKVKSGKFAKLWPLVAGYVLPAGVLLGAFLTAIGASRWLRLRSRHRFPEFEVEPRLGGAHAAGIGAVISFVSAAVPPASQRDQVPDYLRRA
jgi:hypothetical protein